MRYSIYPTKDATIYDQYIYKNTGLDEVIELSKTVSSSNSIENYISRILMKFDTNEITDYLASSNAINPKYFLNLYTLDVKEIPLTYNILILPVSQSWEMGIGKSTDSPETTDGVSWTYRNTYEGEQWATGSYATDSTGSYSNYSGGGTWYTNYNVTQSYDFEDTDIKVDITNIVNAWLSGSISNDGIIIKRSIDDEQSGAYMGQLQFFSRDTHTIYPPKLEIAWDDSSYTTGSLTLLNSDDSFLIYSPNIESSYNELTKAKIRIIGRLKYPIRTYSTQSVYTTVSHCLPSSSYYSIVDAMTKDIVIPFDENYTKISCDENGNYFKFWMNSLQTERIYKILIKVILPETEEIFDDFIFKVVE